ncbi:MAG: glycoside hydrolase family 43 protein [Polyangia bacterium]
MMVLFAPFGCAPHDAVSVDDYSDEAWSAATAHDEAAAELEDAATNEDPTAPSDVISDDADPAETDDVATDDGLEPLAPTMLELVARPGQYQNPVASNCADPGVIRIGGPDGPTFWAACTGNGYPLFQSRDLVHWTAAGHIFNSANRPSWGGGNWWAPEIHHVGNGLVAYFAALSPQRKKICIGAARASSMAGPWVDLGHPLVCDSHVSLIDPNLFTDGNGRHFLYYKTDGNGLSPQERTIIYGQELRADGVGFVGQRHRLIENTLGWEGDVVEAPWVMHRGNYYFMFYSGFRYCNHTYGVGVARATSPLGPFHKRSAPIVHSNDVWTGPGHNSVVPTGGHDYLVYHAWRGAHECSQGGNRALLLDRITWQGGWPFVNSGSPSRGIHTAPTVP